jgi:hypothetical protein
MVDLKDASLRDWLAGQALAGLLAGPQGNQFTPKGIGPIEPKTRAMEAAQRAYEFADAMMKEREKKKK